MPERLLFPGNPLPTAEGYSIEEYLGSGGMGVVFRARDQRTNQLVALKMLNHVDPTGVYRLKREFRVLADIVHRNLVQLIELVCDERSAFFTMELVKGRGFLDYLGASARGRDEPHERRGSTLLLPGAEPEEHPYSETRFDEARTRDAFVELVQGIAAIHRAGRLHCDIKPSNLLVDETGRVVVLDFGVSMGFGQNEQFRTFEGEIAGTPEYMSPEQAAGKPAGPPSDWYAVGAVLYEVLSGRPPFAGSPLGILHKKQVELPVLPSALRSDVPPELEELTMALLAREPSERPTEAAILARLSTPERASFEPAPSSHERPTTFVGRSLELVALERAFADVGPSRPIVTLVTGSSGIGKTSLMQRFFAEVAEQQNVVLLRGRCYERESVPYKAFDPLIDELARFLRRLGDREVAELLPRDIRALSRVFPVLDRVRAVVAARGRSADGADAVELRRRASAALKELLTKLADRFRIVLGIDDLQWGDIDSARLLLDLLEPPDAPSLCVVLCARDSEAFESVMLREVLGDGESGAPLAALRRIELRELDGPETKQLALALLGRGQGETLAGFIARESHGNPFFARELSHHVAGRPPAGAPGAPAPAVVTLGLEPMIRERVDSLQPELRALLELVAVAGQPLTQAVLLDALGDGTAGTSALLALRDAHLVQLLGDPKAWSVECYHDQVRGAVLAGLLPERALECHRLLARALEQSGAVDPEVLLEHYRRSGALPLARRQVLASAQAATRALAFARASRLFGLALELEPESDEQRRELERCFADALANEGRLAEAAAAYQRAAEGLEGLEAIELRRQAAQHFLSSGHTGPGLELLARVLREVGLSYPRSPSAALFRLALERLRLRIFGLSFEERAASEVPPLELARVDVCFSAAVGLALSDLARTAAFSALHLRLALRAGEPMRIARALAFEMGIAPAAGKEGLRWASRALPIAEKLSSRHGDSYQRGLFFLAQGHVAHLGGQWKAAVDWLSRAEKSLRDARAPDVHWALLSGNVLAAISAVASGDLGAVGDRLPLLLKEARQRGDLYSLALMVYPNVVLHLARDRPDAAEKVLTEALSAELGGVFTLREYTGLHCALLVDRYRGDVESAWRRMSGAWEAILRSKILLVNIVRVSALAERGCAAVAMARAGHSGNFFYIAKQCARKLAREPLPFAHALSTLLFASVLRAQGDSKRALATLTQASLELESAGLGMQALCAKRSIGAVMSDSIGSVLVEEIDATLRARGVRNPRRFAEMMAPGFDLE